MLVFAIGHFFASAAPGRTFGWLVAVLYIAYASQVVGASVLGTLGGSFVAGVVVMPVAYWVQARRSGPPVPVTFLPAFTPADTSTRADAMPPPPAATTRPLKENRV